MLKGFAVVPATKTAGVYDDSYPWRALLHKTQGSSTAGAIGAYRSHQGWPHFTVSYGERSKVQHIELGTAARALRNASGGVQTNLARCVQIEIVGFSERAMSNAEADWLTDEVLAPIFAVVPVRAYGPRFYGADEGIVLATTSSPIRMSSAEWRSFNGICGHQHAPENTHWDPGRIPLERIVNRLKQSGTSPSPTPKDWFDMATEADLRKVVRGVVREELDHVQTARHVKTYARDWMAENLPGIVREVVREELDHVQTARHVKTYARNYIKEAVEPELAAIKAAVTKDS